MSKIDILNLKVFIFIAQKLLFTGRMKRKCATRNPVSYLKNDFRTLSFGSRSFSFSTCRCFMGKQTDVLQLLFTQCTARGSWQVVSRLRGYGATPWAPLPGGGYGGDPRRHLTPQGGPYCSLLLTTQGSYDTVPWWNQINFIDGESIFSEILYRHDFLGEVELSEDLLFMLLIFYYYARRSEVQYFIFT